MGSAGDGGLQELILTLFLFSVEEVDSYQKASTTFAVLCKMVNMFIHYYKVNFRFWCRLPILLSMLRKFKDLLHVHIPCTHNTPAHS